MYTRVANTGKRAVLSVLLGIVSILTCSTAVWATTRFGPDIEVQAWYRTRTTFQTDGREHFDWVAWRNEAFVWLTYDNMVKNGNLQLGGGIPIPFVQTAGVSARFRARVDPAYYLRDHYRKINDADKRSDFFAPEKSFRDLYIDMSHGQVGPGTLSSRIGYQQIVWGESDLYRSLDIINPLRIDQTFGIGEKFDEFREPILAAKFLYSLGNIGEWLSEVVLESYYTPRWRGGQTHLLLEDGWRIEYQERGCLGPNGKLVDYSPENCANSRKFLPYRPTWVGFRRAGNPWSLQMVGPTNIIAPDFVCATQRCAPDVAGDRISAIYNVMKGRGTHHTRGTNPGMSSSAGARLLAKTWFGADFSLDYIYIPITWGDGRFFPPSRAVQVYGDFDLPGLPARVGNFEEGLRECLSPSGKSSTRTHPAPAGAIFLTGADLRGYDWPERRLDAKGNPLPTAKQKLAARQPFTICAFGPKHTQRQSHVLGFTGTYNDFDYTGAVLRMEESFSTNEYMNRYPAGYGIHGTRTAPGRTLFHQQVAWRSMLGFDLVSAFGNFYGLHWMRNLPGQLGTNQGFLSFQWLMLYYPATSNNFCNYSNAVGSGPSKPSEEPPARKAVSGCRNQHWNHFFTLGGGGYGYFRGKLEQRLAVAFEPRGQQWLLFGQWWLRNLIPDVPVDLSWGVSWFPGGRFDQSWVALNWFKERNLLWFEGTYYFL